MESHVDVEPDFEALIKRSRTRANRLFYAVIAISVLFFWLYGPTLVDRTRGFMLGVRSAAEAEKQSQLWQKNPSCASRPPEGYLAPSNVKVGVTICNSGDILIRVVPPDGLPIYKWVPLDDVVRTNANGKVIPTASK